MELNSSSSSLPSLFATSTGFLDSSSCSDCSSAKDGISSFCDTLKLPVSPSIEVKVGGMSAIRENAMLGHLLCSSADHYEKQPRGNPEFAPSTCSRLQTNNHKWMNVCVGQNFRLPKGGWEFSHNLIFSHIPGGQNSTGCQLGGKLEFTFQLSENLSRRHLTKEVI